MITGFALRAVLWIASSVFGKQLSEFAAGAIAAALIGIAVIGGSAWALHKSYAYGVEKTEAKWQAKALQSKLDAANADLQGARLAEGNAKLQVKAIRESTDQEKKKDADYIRELENRPIAKGGKPCGCTLTDADRRGMRDGERSNNRPVKARPSGISGWLQRGNTGAAAPR